MATPKSLQSLAIVGYVFRQEFESHESVKTRVLSLVNDTHSAAAQPLDDAIVRDGLADHQGQILRG